jgi:fructose-1-phosphate kinase PfkB-like protein
LLVERQLPGGKSRVRQKMKITIIEFTPCADLIYHIRRDPSEGYIDGDAVTVTLQTGARLRPRLITTYAGGKATNIARVIDGLLTPDDKVEVDLVVFRADSAEGRYIHELESRDLTRVRVRPVIVAAETRLCVNVSDPASKPDNHVEFNISPHVHWDESALESALEFASRVTTDLLLMAGGPPIVGQGGETASDLYAQVIDLLRGRVNVVSLDTDKSALANCLNSPSQPDVIKINEHEYTSVEPELWSGFAGTLIVTDSTGCRLWEKGSSGTPARIGAATVSTLYSTVGAGDAMHAGFSIARWVRGLDMLQAARFGQAVAAATLTSSEASRGISNKAVEGFFKDLTAR